MEVKPGYKQTEVGVIPKDWNDSKLGSIATISRGASPRPIDSPIWFDDSSDVGWVRISDVTKSKRRLSSTTQRLSEAGISHSRYVSKGSLIMSICATVGRSIITDINVCIHDGFVVFDRLNVSQDYLYHILCKLESSWSKHGQTGSQMNLNTGIINPTKIPLPPTKVEQETIAEVLSGTDALIESLEQLIVKKQNIKQGAIQELLTGKRRLPGFGTTKGFKQTEIGKIPKDWKQPTFGEAFDFLPTATYSRAETSTNGDSGYIHYGDIHMKWTHAIDFDKALMPCISKDQVKNYTLLRDGDVIIVDASEDYDGIGKCVVAKNVKGRKVISGLHTYLLRDKFDAIDNGFKGYLHSNALIKNQFDTLATGLKVYGVSRSNLALVLIPLPPTKAEQKAIGTVLSDMDKELEALETKLEKYRMIKQGMMNNLLTGKIRLI